MTYFTGDIHGRPYRVKQFCETAGLSEEDTLVILGDVGANYYGEKRDASVKSVLAGVK